MSGRERLELWLSQMYEADLKHQFPGIIYDMAQKAMSQDTGMREAAQRRLPELKAVVNARGESAYVEKKQLKYIQHMLGEGENG